MSEHRSTPASTGDPLLDRMLRGGLPRERPVRHPPQDRENPYPEG